LSFLGLANPIAASTALNTSPIDIASTRGGKFVYVLESAVGGIVAYQVNGDSLTPVFNRTGLPLRIQGLAVQ
jgi:hypothetical protein